MIHYNPKDHSYPYRYLDLHEKIYNELIAEINSRPKTPPQKRLSKKEFYKLVEKEPLHLFMDGFDEREERNSGKVVWFPLCEEPFPLEEVMKLREKYFLNLF